jgi:flagellar biosynthesis protein FliQ
MNEADALDIVQTAIWTVLVCSGPAVFVAMFVGVGIAFIQALTQVQEITLTFVPKIVAISGHRRRIGPLCRRPDLHLYRHRLSAHPIRILGQIQRELEPVIRPELRETKVRASPAIPL